MTRRTTARRPASWSRGTYDNRVVKKDDAFRPLAETLRRSTIAVDAGADLHGMLIEVAFDVLGAARWTRDENQSFARAAVASALDELRFVAERLEVGQ